MRSAYTAGNEQIRTCIVTHHLQTTLAVAMCLLSVMDVTTASSVLLTLSPAFTGTET